MRNAVILNDTGFSRPGVSTPPVSETCTADCHRLSRQNLKIASASCSKKVKLLGMVCAHFVIWASIFFKALGMQGNIRGQNGESQRFN